MPRREQSCREYTAFAPPSTVRACLTSLHPVRERLWSSPRLESLQPLPYQGEGRASRSAKGTRRASSTRSLYLVSTGSRERTPRCYTVPGKVVWIGIIAGVRCRVQPTAGYVP